MADQARGERMIRIFVYMMAHYNNRYSVADIMRHLDIREEDLRSVQRDMHALSPKSRVATSSVPSKAARPIIRWHLNAQTS